MTVNINGRTLGISRPEWCEKERNHHAAIGRRRQSADKIEAQHLAWGRSVTTHALVDVAYRRFYERRGKEPRQVPDDHIEHLDDFVAWANRSLNDHVNYSLHALAATSKKQGQP